MQFNALRVDDLLAPQLELVRTEKFLRWWPRHLFEVRLLKKLLSAFYFILSLAFMLFLGMSSI